MNLVQALAEFPDLELHVVTTDASCTTVTQTRWGPVTVHRLPLAGHWVLTGAIGVGRRQLQEYLSRLAPDVVHAHDIYGLMVKGLSVPRVFTIHGFIHADTLVSGERLAWFRAHLWRLVERSGWADQPHIISISPYVRERLTGIATGVIHDIENPIAASFFEITRQERRGTIFSAGLICPRKNTLGLVEAFARVVEEGCDARLRLAGHASDPHYASQVEQRIRTLRLEDRIAVLGRLGSDEVRKELSIASVFALVSLEENSPMGIEEAMAAGVPVVTSNRCGMPYMVRNGESGFLVDPLAPAEIARRLRQLLEDDSLRAAMGERSREIAHDRFHPSAVARRTRDVYLRAAKRDGGVRQFTPALETPLREAGPGDSLRQAHSDAAQE